MQAEEEIIERIKEFFEDNYEMLRMEGGYALTEDIKQEALNQVIYYYKRLRDVAERVTETEVKLSLPEQKTPKGKNFVIEGIVDIVREDYDTRMYDIKTHDRDYIENNKELFGKQLDVYSYIWQKLRNEELNHTAIISTSLPDSLKNAIRSEDQKKIDAELERWEPIIYIPFNQKKVRQTIEEFGRVVDEIEEKNFKPAPTEKLHEIMKGEKVPFGTRFCLNCDARFSCQSFKEYFLRTGKGTKSAIEAYFDDFGTEADREQWIDSNLQATDISQFENE